LRRVANGGKTTRVVPDTFPAHLDPAALLRARDGIYAADLLIAAIVELDFFSRVAGRDWTEADLAAELGIEARPASVLITLLCAMELLERDGERVRMGALAEVFLTRSSCWDLGPYFASLKLRPQVQQILQVLETDRPAPWESSEANADWATAMEDEAFGRRITAAMNGRGEWFGPSLARALPLDDVSSVLDIGGGSGVYARILKEHSPGLTVAVLEKSPIDKVARDYLDSTEAGRHVEVSSGDMFAAIPEGFDLHLYSNVLHDWGQARVRELLARSRDSLNAGGRIAVHDAFVNRDKCGPLDVAEYSVLLMVLSEGQCYSVGEMETFLVDAGFRDVSYQPTTAGRGVMLARTA
jgi:predicted O-methyltransferase YrrM